MFPPTTCATELKDFLVDVADDEGKVTPACGAGGLDAQQLVDRLAATLEALMDQRLTNKPEKPKQVSTCVGFTKASPPKEETLDTNVTTVFAHGLDAANMAKLGKAVGMRAAEVTLVVAYNTCNFEGVELLPFGKVIVLDIAGLAVGGPNFPMGVSPLIASLPPSTVLEASRAPFRNTSTEWREEENVWHAVGTMHDTANASAAAGPCLTDETAATITRAPSAALCAGMRKQTASSRHSEVSSIRRRTQLPMAPPGSGFGVSRLTLPTAFFVWCGTSLRVPRRKCPCGLPCGSASRTW